VSGVRLFSDAISRMVDAVKQVVSNAKRVTTLMILVTAGYAVVH